MKRVALQAGVRDEGGAAVGSPKISTEKGENTNDHPQLAQKFVTEAAVLFQMANDEHGSFLQD